MIRALLIDLDGVIRIWSWQPDESHGITREEFAAVAFTPELAGRAVVGAISDEEWRERIASALSAKHGEVGRRVVEHWTAHPAAIDRDIVDLVRSLRPRRRTALITNATTRLDADLTAHDVKDAFDVIVNSSIVGYAKPDERIFTFAAAALGVAIEECLFVDDTPAHVDAAANLGMHAVLYAGPDDLRDRLGSLGLLT